MSWRDTIASIKCTHFTFHYWLRLLESYNHKLSLSKVNETAEKLAVHLCNLTSLHKECINYATNMIKGSFCGRFRRFWKLPVTGTGAKTNNKI